MGKTTQIATIEGMRAVGKLASQTLDMIEEYITPGVTTEELDNIINAFIINNGAISACINYLGYPKYTCISVNHIACHGIPCDKKLKNGDIVNVDVTLIVDGMHGDTSRMFQVGKTSIKAQRISKLAKGAMEAGIAVVAPGITTGDIGHAIGLFCQENRVNALKQYCGHSIGMEFHGDLQIPSYGELGSGDILKVGDFITIEPILTLGKDKTNILSDGWTVVMSDRALTAQWEHTLVVTEDGYEILTIS